MGPTSWQKWREFSSAAGSRPAFSSVAASSLLSQENFSFMTNVMSCVMGNMKDTNVFPDASTGLAVSDHVAT
jgi:hypothetical protein